MYIKNYYLETFGLLYSCLQTTGYSVSLSDETGREGIGTIVQYCPLPWQPSYPPPVKVES